MTPRPPTNEVYVRYAGLNPILTFRLYQVLRPRLTGDLVPLYGYEMRLANLLDTIRRRGCPSTSPTPRRRCDLLRQRRAHLEVRADYGLTTTKLDTAVEKEAFAQALITQGLPGRTNVTCGWLSRSLF